MGEQVKKNTIVLFMRRDVKDVVSVIASKDILNRFGQKRFLWLADMCQHISTEALPTLAQFF